MTELDRVSGKTRPGGRPGGLPALPAERDGPVFEQPWQATAFALAVHLAERGAIPWSEWSAALGGRSRRRLAIRRSSMPIFTIGSTRSSGCAPTRAWPIPPRSVIARRNGAAPMSIRPTASLWS